jgi:hypothetical protein
MKDRPDREPPEDVLEGLVVRRPRQVPFERLMPRRIRNLLLVASHYDSFTFEEDGALGEVLQSDFLELSLRQAPRIERVPTARRALERLAAERFDLVISMLRVGDMNVRDFGRAVRRIDPSLPVVLLAFSARELAMIEAAGELPGIDRAFLWSGDVRLFLAIIKYVEDRLNAWHDVRAAGVQCVILVEDSVRFYSSYLPMLYTEIMEQTRAILSDSLNRMQRLSRLHARPKVLLATSYEQAHNLYNQYQDSLICTIVDMGFPRGGVVDPQAGRDFARMVVSERPYCAILVQSSDQDNAEFAASIGAAFINKRSAGLLHSLRDFMQLHLGFGDFVFRRPDGSVVTSASDLRSLAEAIAIVPEESLLHHGRRNDFSKWLLARAEFDLARAIRYKRWADFSSPAEIRRHLLDSLARYRASTRAGIVSEFSEGTFEAGAGFVRIGSGSLGGKGRGLAFFHHLLSEYEIEDHVPGVRLFVPPTAVLATGVFDHLMQSGNLTDVALGDRSDEEIDRAFTAARLPEEVRGTLRTFLSRVHYPLAVRSSSLLEDASYQPFAGVYRTFMLPNNAESLEERLNELTRAIKLVYASTYGREARAYLDSTPNRLEEEKMAVVIQEVVGRCHGRYLYPDMAGVARSHNFYPLGRMRSEDGVVCAVLGLGRAVVEGGRCLRFSPADPTAIYAALAARDFMTSGQRELLALDLSRTFSEGSDPAAAGIVSLDLEEAERHGTFQVVGAVYSPQDRRLHEAGTRGVRLVTFQRLLEDGAERIHEALGFLLSAGRSAFSWPVEIEFAVKLGRDASEPHQLGFLQIRPMSITVHAEEVADVSADQAICISHQSLGHGQGESVRDVVYVKSGGFNRASTAEIADEIGALNEVQRGEERRYVLIGPGRWGSTDPRLGIPVTWGQISSVSCLVETELPDIRVSPSQGSHFFHNITSFGVGCLSVGSGERGGMLDTAYLDARPAVRETAHVRHVRFDAPLRVMIDGRTGYGVILKPEHAAQRAPGLSLIPPRTSQ